MYATYQPTGNTIYLDRLECGEAAQFSYRALQMRVEGRRGRPRFDIPREQLVYLASLSFNWVQIASILGVSRMTMYRRRQELGIVSEPRQELNLSLLLC